MYLGYHKSSVYVFQIRSNEAMDEKERLSLRSQSRTTSRQTSPRMGARKSMSHLCSVKKLLWLLQLGQCKVFTYDSYEQWSKLSL